MLIAELKSEPVSKKGMGFLFVLEEMCDVEPV
jgi:hypothetical protein